MVPSERRATECHSPPAMSVMLARTDHRDRARAIREGAISQLALSVVSPGPQGPARRQRQRVVVSGGDCLDVGQAQAPGQGPHCWCYHRSRADPRSRVPTSTPCRRNGAPPSGSSPPRWRRPGSGPGPSAAWCAVGSGAMVPSPSWPNWFAPRVQTVPSDASAMLCCSPAATATMPESPGIWRGPLLPMVRPERAMNLFAKAEDESVRPEHEAAGVAGRDGGDGLAWRTESCRSGSARTRAVSTARWRSAIPRPRAVREHREPCHGGWRRRYCARPLPMETGVGLGTTASAAAFVPSCP